ncbi:hypothetical protein cym2001_15320 [Pseudomonas sp. CYM-20-01]|jgi:hypothetical protein|uniref:hypothetical protein n=1 Tax=Pseudomonas sp. CYM-20-01 TaxID=2870750 RepID=UPI00204893EF|nr:hypothetical protein [Pseudomonas sp. CYM-20-01]BDB18167.1 hypothetical protein cym2001_15320 [Pseudomonas sp. CYM-20-01]
MGFRRCLCGFLLVASSALAGEPARVEFSSATDFAAITVDLKQDLASNPGVVWVDVELSPQARARLKAISLLTINQRLSIYVDGLAMSATPSVVRSVLDGFYVRMGVPQDLFIKWVPWGRH